MEDKFPPYSFSELVGALEAKGCVVSGRTYKCAFHEDKQASGSLYEREGKWRAHCHVCDYNYDLYDLTGTRGGSLKTSPLPCSSPTYQPTRTGSYGTRFRRLRDICSRVSNLERVYLYNSKFAVLRIQEPGKPKTFRQVRKNHDGFWEFGGIESPPLYRWRSCRDSDTVVVVEGERAAEALRWCGFCATTSCGGANAASKTKKEAWSVLNGRRVVVWPDNDECGRVYAKTVLGLVKESAQETRLIDPASLGLGAKEDAVEFVLRDRRTAKERVRCVLDSAEKIENGGFQESFGAFMRMAMSGALRPCNWPWPNISSLTAPLTPGSVTLLCGLEGAGKSFFLMQALLHWLGLGVTCSVLMLEDDKNKHALRALAQTSGCPALTKLDWLAQNPEVVSGILTAQAGLLDAIGGALFDMTGEVDVEKVEEWARERSKAGARIVAIDPLAAITGDKQDGHLHETALMNKMRDMAKEYKNAVLLVMHPRKGAAHEKNIGLDDVQGSKNLTRLCHTGLWLHWHEDKESFIDLPMGCEHKIHNRTVQILKTRDDSGTGKKIAFNWNPNLLKFEELGIIRRED